jgi:formamidopyrimidine-DNA glycosylase
MPELPEVEYTRRQLRPVMEGARFVRVVTRRASLRYPFSTDFVTRLEGQTVRAVSRRAKYLLAELSSGDVLMMHLGMSGSFRVVRGPARPRRVPKDPAYDHRKDPAYERHDHVVFEMSSGSTVIFNDPRRFGFMKIIAGSERTRPTTDAKVDVDDWSKGILGPEPLDRAFTPDVLAKALARKTTSLKAALLDQRVVAGLGNIYVCEALHRARLSPKRKASTIVSRSGVPTPKAVALVRAIKETLRDAIAHNHRVSGDDRFRVYDHEAERCPRRGCPGTIVRIVQGGRSTFFCPICQR